MLSFESGTLLDYNNSGMTLPKVLVDSLCSENRKKSPEQ
jgi:hypothetical protein